MMNKKFRKIKKRFLVIVDGKTEIWYFQSMKKVEKFKNLQIKPDLPKKKSLKELNSYCIEQKKMGYDKVFLLLDFDVFLKEERESKSGYLQNVYREIEKIKKNGIEVLINSPCIEIWYLLHYKDTTKNFDNCKKTIEELKKYLRKYEKKERFIKTIYKKLELKINYAIKNSKKLGRFSKKNFYKSLAEIYIIIEFLKNNESNTQTR